VTTRTSLAVWLSAIGLVAACEGDGDGSMRATLTDGECAYEGPASAHAGRFTIDVANETRSFGAFFLAAVDDDGEGDLQSTIDDLLRRFKKSGESPARVPCG
jgi:hypothetical protein